MLSTTLSDKENQEMFENNIVEYYDERYQDEPAYYRIKFGHGTYDSRYYNFIGFYLERCNKDGSKNSKGLFTDGTANMLFYKEYIKSIG